MTQKKMFQVAKAEIEQWNQVPAGVVIAILWAFIHRVTTGNTVEETFFNGKEAEDYQI